MNFKKIFYSVICLALGSLFVIGGRSYAQTNCLTTCINGGTDSVTCQNQCCVPNCVASNSSQPDVQSFCANYCANHQTTPTTTTTTTTNNSSNNTQVVQSQCTDNSQCTTPGYVCDTSNSDSLLATYDKCILSSTLPPNVGPSQAPAGSGCTVSSSVLSGDKNASNDFDNYSCSCNSGYGQLNGNGACALCTNPNVCCGTRLNTSVPFIGNCIATTAQGGKMAEGEAFPVLITALMKILVTAILIVSFVLIIIGGVMISTGGAEPNNVAAGKKMIRNVIIGLAILGASGVILRLINPNFFG